MIFFSPGTFLTSFLLQVQTQSLAELFRQLIGTKQEEVWARSPMHGGAPRFSAAPGSAVLA